MSLKDKFKELMFSAMKTRDAVAKDLFSTLLGEVQSVEQKTGVELPDDKVVGIVKKFIENNKSVIKSIDESLNQDQNYLDRVNMKNKCEKENILLSSFIPKTLSLDEMFAKVDSTFIEVIKSLTNVGQAVGQTIKHFKTMNYNLDGNITKQFVELVKNPQNG